MASGLNLNALTTCSRVTAQASVPSPSLPTTNGRKGFHSTWHGTRLASARHHDKLHQAPSVARVAAAQLGKSSWQPGNSRDSSRNGGRSLSPSRRNVYSADVDGVDAPSSAGEADLLEEMANMVQIAEQNMSVLAEGRLKAEQALAEAQAEAQRLRERLATLEEVLSDVQRASKANAAQAQAARAGAPVDMLSPSNARGAKGAAPAQAVAPAVVPPPAAPVVTTGDTSRDWSFWSGLLQLLDTLHLKGHLRKEEYGMLQLMAWSRDARLGEMYEAAEGRCANERELGMHLMKGLKLPGRPGLHVVNISAEMAPVAKVGGLGDVVTGLGRALQKKGHLVEVILPKYDCMDTGHVLGLQDTGYEFQSFFDNRQHANRVWRGTVAGLPVYFIEPLHPDRFFNRGHFYGQNDDFRRFTYFCRAALEFLHRSGKAPDIIHCHDWQTAAVAPLFWDVFFPLGMASTRIFFTCHNYEYQGTAHPNELAACGLAPAVMNVPEKMKDNFVADRINLLKGGIVFSNKVTTVSPTYSREARTPEGGRGLHVTLNTHAAKFSGILNGIDDDVWDPANDPLLAAPFSIDDLSGKRVNKDALRRQLGMAYTGFDGERPLVGCVTRLVPQKGVHLIRHAIFRTVEKGGQFVLLGSSPVPNIQQEFEALAREHARHPHIRIVLKYDEALSHLIYAGSDVFTIPSVFEPCGLTQLIAMRYGSIPVARKTGGLADSVFDVDDRNNNPEDTNGFVFGNADVQGLNYALDRALQYYWDHRDWWSNLVQQAMSMDYSWDSACHSYLDMYKDAIDSP
eukprot:jgi/Mesvir1/28810/Mv12896-RA.1